jgi:hypothetical protein
MTETVPCIHCGRKPKQYRWWPDTIVVECASPECDWVEFSGVGDKLDEAVKMWNEMNMP